MRVFVLFFSMFETALICTVALRGAALHSMAILQIMARNSRVKFVTDDSLNFYFPKPLFSAFYLDLAVLLGLYRCVVSNIHLCISFHFYF